MRLFCDKSIVFTRKQILTGQSTPANASDECQKAEVPICLNDIHKGSESVFPNEYQGGVQKMQPYRLASYLFDCHIRKIPSKTKQILLYNIIQYNRKAKQIPYATPNPPSPSNQPAEKTLESV